MGKYDDLEIDFVCFKENQTKYVQVALSLPESSTRETDNLLIVRDNYERIVVTYDYKDVGMIDGIKIIHLTTFLTTTTLDCFDLEYLKIRLTNGFLCSYITIMMKIHFK